MSDNAVIQIPIDDILNDAVDTTNGDATYITHTRLRVTNNDVTLDMYYVGSNPKDPNGRPIAYLRNRIVLPVGLAKDISNLLANAMSDWEETFGINLPILPFSQEDDNE